MANNLMIVESPYKCKKLVKILKQISKESNDGDTWVVKPSVGHVLDLNSSNDGKFGSLGFDEETLEADYVPTKRGAKIIKELKSLIKSSNFDRIILAPDPDREGEAIAENLREVLNLGDNYERCTFNEITKKAVKEAIDNPRKVDINLVMSQDARRILDRFVGWKGTAATSKVLGTKTPVGRVQSKVVDFVVQREIERNNFKETEYYGIHCKMDGGWKANLDIKASELLPDGASYWQNLDEAKFYAGKMKNLIVSDVEKTHVAEEAPMPFETSSMQQAAINKLGFSVEECTNIAQSLYQDGLITYIRTDSTAISDDGFALLKEYCEKEGLPVLDQKRVGKASAVAQEAHECIRPSDFSYDSSNLSGKAKELYELIKIRCLASQLKPAEYDRTAMKFKVDMDDLNDISDENEESFDKLDKLLFKASGKIMTYKGWRVLLDGDDSDIDDDDGKKDSESDIMPDLAVDDSVTPESINVDEKKTKMPPRYNQATLLKKLEQHKVGRPSTYNSIFYKIGEEQHGYVIKEGGKKNPKLSPSEHAMNMVKSTKEYLSIMDTEFTKEMEGTLDNIAKGEQEREEYLHNFLGLFDSELEKMIEKQGVKKKEYNYVDCLKCGEKKLTRVPKREKGFFWVCRNEGCKATFSDKDGKPVDAMAEFINKDGSPKYPCPKCSKPVIRITTKAKKKLWVCSTGKENCGFITDPIKGKDAPDFEKEKRAAEWRAKVEAAKNEDGTPIHPCPNCGNALVKVEKRGAKGEYYYRCASNKNDCDYTCSADEEGNPIKKD